MASDYARPRSRRSCSTTSRIDTTGAFSRSACSRRKAADRPRRPRYCRRLLERPTALATCNLPEQLTVDVVGQDDIDPLTHTHGKAHGHCIGQGRACRRLVEASPACGPSGPVVACVARERGTMQRRDVFGWVGLAVAILALGLALIPGWTSPGTGLDSRAGEPGWVGWFGRWAFGLP